MKIYLKFGLIAFVISMLAFFIVYTFFFNQSYYITSIRANAFVMPFVFALAGFFAAFIRKKEIGILSFQEGFKQSFLSMFIGGILSLGFVFVFFNYVDTDAKEVFIHQGIDTYLNGAKSEYASAKKINKETKKIGSQEDKMLDEQIKIIEERMNSDEIRKTNYFSFRNVSVFLSVLSVFYLLLSLFFAGFLKNTPNYQDQIVEGHQENLANENPQNH